MEKTETLETTSKDTSVRYGETVITGWKANAIVFGVILTFVGIGFVIGRVTTKG